MKLLEGKASDILLDYADGMFELIEDSTGKFLFVDTTGETFELTEEVEFYLNLLRE